VARPAHVPSIRRGVARPGAHPGLQTWSGWRFWRSDQVPKRANVRGNAAGRLGRSHPAPQPDPGRELDCDVKRPLGGVINTCWNTPPTGSDTTTKAGELVIVPLAHVGSQLLTCRVPPPDPEALPQIDHVMVVIDMSPLAQPMEMNVGITRGVDP
jgi:hypothetical protein